MALKKEEVVLHGQELKPKVIYNRDNMVRSQARVKHGRSDNWS